MPQTHLQFILEVAVLIYVGVILFFNVINIPLSMVLFFSLILTVFLAALFGIDTAFLFLPYIGHHEFTHPFGSLALFSWVTLIASANLLSEVDIKSSSIKALAIILFAVIGIAGGLMHRSFILIWLVGWLMGTIIMSKSFRRSSRITPKKVIGVIIATLAAFGILEFLAKIFSQPVLSPLLRLTRLADFAIPSLKMVIENTALWGHVQGSCFWGASCLGGCDGYITLPMSMVTFFTLPFPMFGGILVDKKDAIDYMLPGIFGLAFDFGYGVLFLIMVWSLIVMGVGFYVLRKYRTKRRNGSRRYLGREALLIGALTAFIAQSIIGMFIFNRSINGSAMLTYLFLSALVLAHMVSVRTRV